ncbi:MAG: hypothetical protein JWO03_4051 [Bacteroidetes bacterium]|nr:hypothetical protein [Bacteroidota bacterium]
MSKHHISIEIGAVKNKAELMEKAKTALAKHNGTLDGDEHSGSFDLPIMIGHIKGNYTITDNTFNLEITRKPLLVSYKRIEAELRKHLG